MSVSTLESENAQPVAQTQNSELIYRLEDRPPLPQTLFAACQHLLAMFVAVITPALLICQALGLPAQDTQHIISMSLFASGVASIIQIKAWGPVGSGLLSIQGTSFNFVAPLIMGGTALKTGGADVPTMMAALFGTLMLASCTEMVISRVLHLARRIITPLVSGVVVMIIGLSLIQVGLTSIGGGYAAMSDNTFGAPKNLLLAGVVLALIILLNRQRNPYLRVASLVIAMAAGYALAWFMGMLPESNEPMTQELIMVPTPLYYGLGIEWSLLLPLMLIYIKTRMLLSIHDEEAMSEMEQLIATLEAHQRGENYLKIKEVVPQLDSRYTYGRDFLTKEPEPLQPNREYRYVHPREDLKKAMLAVLARSDNKLPPPVSAFQGIVGREPYPVAEKAMEILNRLLRLGVTRFRSLFQGSRSRSEVVATFLAVLELCRAHRLRLAGTAEDCTVTSTGTGAPEEISFREDGIE